jgi:hypothetical protein
VILDIHKSILYQQSEICGGKPCYDPRANGCASENCRVVEVDLMHRDCGMGFSVALANDNLRRNQIRGSTIKNIDGTEAKT